MSLYDFENREKPFSRASIGPNQVLPAHAKRFRDDRFAESEFAFLPSSSRTTRGVRTPLSPEPGTTSLCSTPTPGPVPPSGPGATCAPGRQDSTGGPEYCGGRSRTGQREDNPWGVSFQLMFMMNDRFRPVSYTRDELEARGLRTTRQYLRGRTALTYLPLYEAQALPPVRPPLRHLRRVCPTKTSRGGKARPDDPLRRSYDPEAVVPASLLGPCPRSWDKGQGTRDKGQGTRDKGQGTRDKGQGTRDKGQGTRDKGQGTRDKGLYYRGSCPTWLRKSLSGKITRAPPTREPGSMLSDARLLGLGRLRRSLLAVGICVFRDITRLHQHSEPQSSLSYPGIRCEQ